ncbi:hypothetical protein BJV82DRAFT_507620 [Fennellomyces sp. T-0311]|nr:hypothetical protein BJV82DRAFT_507620 [Fennellomyces sp. T-0311]
MPHLHDAYLFGEMGFLIVGLKPCVLIEFPRVIMEQYKHNVLDRVEQAFGERGIRMLEIQGNVTSPEMSLKGCWIAYHSRLHPGVEEVFHGHLTEEMLATALDYPGSLPTSQEQVPHMLEVIYYIQLQDQVQIVTTFAALDHEREKVIAHYQKYRDMCREKLGLDILVLLRRPQ